MIVINFWNVKGGTGKSSLSLLSARHLARCGKRVLLMDLDAQRSISRVFDNGENVDSPTLFDFLFDQCPLTDVLLEPEPNLYIAPGSLKILKIQNSIPERKFKDAFSGLKDFDFVIMDNAPTLSGLIASSIAATHILVIPSQISLFDFQEVIFTLDEARRVNPSIRPAVLLNRVQAKGRITKDEREYLEMFSAELSDHLLENRIPNTISVRRSIDRGTDPGDVLGDALKSLADELVAIMDDAGCVDTSSSVGSAA